MIVQSNVVVCLCMTESLPSALGERMSPTVAMLIGLGIGLLVVVVVILAMVLYVRLRPTQTYHPHRPTPDSPYMTYNNFGSGLHGEPYDPGRFPPNSPL
jgi:hypothetical protein